MRERLWLVVAMRRSGPSANHRYIVPHAADRMYGIGRSSAAVSPAAPWGVLVL